jgi:histidyl-tRNA synthetase
MMSGFKTARGMRDFLPQEAAILRGIEGKARRVAELYGYNEIVTPIVESYELLAAKAGEEVKSRMFVFKDLGGRDVALRPEFTASVARLVATTLKNQPRPSRLFSVGSVYRYDEPQKGRYREFWQSNYELMGSEAPVADAEIVLLTNSLMQACDVRNCVFKVGHVGVLRGIFDAENLEDRVQNAVMQLMDKKQYDDALKMLANNNVSAKCIKILRELVKLKGQEVFEIVKKMQNLVENHGKAVEASKNLFEILRIIYESACDIDVFVDAGFARGLEYYTGMIFEVNVPELDIALGGGGRYDKLIELFGGESTPAIGVAHGLDRIMLAMQEQKVSLGAKLEKSVAVIPISEKLNGEALKIAQLLRDAGMHVEVEVMSRKMAKALENADRRAVDFAVIVGERELKEGAVVLRDLKKRTQQTVKINAIASAIKNKDQSKVH